MAGVASRYSTCYKFITSSQITCIILETLSTLFQFHSELLHVDLREYMYIHLHALVYSCTCHNYVNTHFYMYMYCTCIYPTHVHYIIHVVYMYIANVFGNCWFNVCNDCVCVFFSSFENEINEKYNFLTLGQFLQIVLYACTHVHICTFFLIISVVWNDCVYMYMYT